jgi:hypothetical protein
MGQQKEQTHGPLTQGAPLFGLLIIFLAVAGLFDIKISGGPTGERWTIADCQAWDHTAVEGLIPLMYGGSGAAELKLTEGLAQLRRARLYCRRGSAVVARNDYLALHRAYPVTTGTIRDPLSSKYQNNPIINVKD